MTKKLVGLILTASILFSAQVQAVKFSDITSGGALAPSTDKLVTVRNGNTDVLTTPAASAITDTTNASNISTGTLAVTRGGTGSGTAGGALDSLTGATGFLGQWLSRTAAGTWSSTPSYQVLGTCNLLDYDPTFTSEGETTQGTSFENWMLDCQKKAINLGAANKSNLGLPSCIEAVTTGLSTFGMTLNTPEVLPRYVCWKGNVTQVRDGTAGTPLANWNGDTTTRQLSNLYQPFWILPPTSQVTGTIRIIANSNGTDRGSGFDYGKTWRMASLTAQATGTGFVGGETCTVAIGDAKGPAAGATFTVATASGGAVTGIAFSPTQWATQTGQYYLPPVLQRKQWSVSTACNVNGVNDCWDGHDSMHPQVFDNDTNHYYKTTCSGSGTGLTVSAKFWPDWCSGAAADSDTVSCATNTSGPNGTNAYDGVFSDFYAGAGYLGQIYVVQSGQSFSSTYGYTFGGLIDAAELTSDYIQTNAAHYGLIVQGSDIVIKHHNDVGSTIQEKVRGGSIHILEARLDTPTDSINNDAHAVEADKASNVDISGTFFHNGNSAADVGSPYIRTGSDTSISSSSNENTGLIIKGQVFSVGTSGTSLTALGCAYTNGSLFDLDVANLSTSHAANAQQFTKFVNFGSNCETGNSFRGGLDNQSDPLYSGTMPAVAFNITNGKTGAIENSCQVVAQGAAGWTDTAIGTSEVNLVSVALPSLGPNDQLKISTLWTKGGTLTDTTHAIIRLGTAACTSLAACSSGTSFMDITQNTSSFTSMKADVNIANQNATNAQVTFASASQSNTTSSGAVTTGTIQTNGTPFLNIDATTTTSSADSEKLESYRVERCNGGS